MDRTTNSPRTVSIIIPTHNRLAYLGEAIGSVFAQSHEHWEIIIIDDMSDDGTWEWLQEKQDGDRLRGIRLDEKSGSTVTRNAGLRLARGDYCLFFDDDDHLPAEALATHIEAIEARPDVIATVGSVRNFDPSGFLGMLQPTKTRRIQGEIWRDVLFWWSFMLGASLFRTSTIRQVGGFDESILFYGDDVDLWMRIGHLGNVHLIPETVIHWRFHGQQRPEGYMDMLTELGNRHAATWSPRRRAQAQRIQRARAAVWAVRLEAGRPGNWMRQARLFASILRNPFLLSSPVASGEILRAVQRDIRMDPWLRRLRRPPGREPA